MTQEWTRVEGMIIGRDLDPATVAQELRERSVLAQLEWFPETPQLLGLNLAVADGAIAVVPRDGVEAVAGPSPEALAEELAILFEAEVRIGSAACDHLPEGDAPLSQAWPGDEVVDEDLPSRIVEIGRTPASSVPLLAALEGVDLGDLELADDHRALLAELPPEKAGWNFGELPLVTLSVSEGEFQIFLVTDDHLEHIVTHNWGMDALLVPGGHQSHADLPDEVLDLVGDWPDLSAIARAIPGSDVEALRASVDVSGEEAVWTVVRALGLPAGIAGFLLGSAQMDEVEGVSVHLARGISNAIGRSVDIMLKEPESPVQPLWAGYQEMAVERPWVIRTAAAVEAVVGTGLLAACVRAARPRSGWRIFSGVLGSLMIVDSVAELSLAKYVALRHERKNNEE